MDITTSDPYVKIKCGSRNIGHTTVKLRCLNPVWNETFQIPLLHLKETLFLKVFDEDHGKEHDIMGVVIKDVLEAYNEIREQGKLTSTTPTSFRMPLKLNDLTVKGELYFSILIEVR
jgi:Ca2+-dependent lipid-binding protein